MSILAHVGYSTLLTLKVLYYTTVIILVIKSLRMEFLNLMGITAGVYYTLFLHIAAFLRLLAIFFTVLKCLFHLSYEDHMFLVI
jgi:hypothetical protein